jgi:DNA-binding transcriptional regulator GbsR (MarR family)
MTQALQDTREAFIEKIGLIAQNDRLPRIAGRVLGMLVWDGEAVSFGDLAERLQVSRGSISTATRILEEHRVIRRLTKAGQRQDYFQLAEHPYPKLLEMLAGGVSYAQGEIEATLQDIPECEADIRKRVGAYCAFYGHLVRALAQLQKDLCKDQ